MSLRQLLLDELAEAPAAGRSLAELVDAAGDEVPRSDALQANERLEKAGQRKDLPAEDKLARGRRRVIADALNGLVYDGLAEADGRGDARTYRLTAKGRATARPAPRRITLKGGASFRPLFPDLFEPLTPEERESLRDSVRLVGVLVPVLLDGEDGIIDGINRLEIAAELGLTIDDVPVERRIGLTREEKECLALTLNMDRRQLTPEQQRRRKGRRVELVAKLRRQGHSIRAIAEKVGVSAIQVRRDLEEASTVPGGTVEPPEKVVGLDGKERPAKMPPKPPPPPAAPPPAPEPDIPVDDEEGEDFFSGSNEQTNTSTGTPVHENGKPGKGPPRDKLGFEITDPAVAEAFGVYGVMREVRRKAAELAVLIDRLAKHPGGVLARRTLQPVEKQGGLFYASTHLKVALSELAACLPYLSFCPDCSWISGRVNPSCKKCGGRGWQIYRELECAEPAVADAIRAAAKGAKEAEG